MEVIHRVQWTFVCRILYGATLDSEDTLASLDKIEPVESSAALRAKIHFLKYIHTNTMYCLYGKIF